VEIKYAKMLEELGFSREQAETSIKILLEVMEEKLATKIDIQMLSQTIQSDIKQFKSEMTIRLGIMMASSIAIVALGNIADPESKIILKKHLQDPEPNVQWGAAISLARMNDRSGKAILMQMLSRQYWATFNEVDLNEQNNLLISAISASVLLNDPELNEQIDQIAQSDSNMKVRAAPQAANSTP